MFRKTRNELMSSTALVTGDQFAPVLSWSPPRSFAQGYVRDAQGTNWYFQITRTERWFGSITSWCAHPVDDFHANDLLTVGERPALRALPWFEEKSE